MSTNNGPVRLSNVIPVPLQWLWPGRIPLGKLCLLVGDPGLGKSLITCDFAARISQGSVWPDDIPCAQGSVFMAGAEDDLEDTIRPRLDAAGAACDNIYSLNDVAAAGGKRKPWHLGNVAALAAYIENITPAVRLVIVDPAQAHVPSGINSNSNTEVRALLAPLATYAASAHLTILLVDHLNKRSDVGPMYRAGGSIAWTAAARASFAVARDTANPEVCVFGGLKHNLAPPAPTLAYKLVSTAHKVARVEWLHDVTPTSVHDLLTPAAPGANRGRPDAPRRKAVDWLSERLGDGTATVAELESEANDLGFSWRTVLRAKEALGVESHKVGDGWLWSQKWGKMDVTPELQ